MLHIMRRINSTKLLLNNKHQMCSKADVKQQSQKIPEDWQYCQMITSQLKKNQINQALSLLNQSYFNKRILDMQIYNCVFEKMQQLSMHFSYSQVLYELYRDHFPPHPLIINWMNKLTNTQNPVLLQKLKEDFLAINTPFPQQPRSRKQKMEKIKEETIAKRQKQPKNQQNANKTNIQTQNDEPRAPSSQSSKDDMAKFTAQEMMKLRMVSDIKDMVNQIGNLTDFSKISVHDVQIQMNNMDDMDPNQEMPDNEPYDDMNEMNEGEPPYGMFGLDISKIKIGRIDFTIDNSKNNDKE